MAIIKITDETNHVDINGSLFPKDVLSVLDYQDEPQTVVISLNNNTLYSAPFGDYRDDNDEALESKSALISYLATCLYTASS